MIQSSAERGALPGLRERIAVLLANTQNARLLADVLGARYDVVHDLDGDPVDCCIVDGVMLQRSWARLARLREQQEPLFLPVLLATDRGDVNLLTRDLWRVVDDVIMRPIEKAELRARVATMLRVRGLSIQLRRMAGLYEHERRIAHRLQEAALPSAFPRVPGAVFSAVYRAGSDEALIGGDWYDVSRLSDGRVVLTVGDVSGAGLDAAVSMSNIRQVLRGVAQVHADPGLILAAADRALALEEGDRQVTAFVGVFDPITGFLAYASAGHPPALLRHRDGTLAELTTRGLPLGVRDPAPRLAHSVSLLPGELLVVHTDGLTEADRDVIGGELRLQQAIRSGGFAAMSEPALALQGEVLRGEARDDVAILVMQLRADAGATPELRRWILDPTDAESARAVRGQIVAALQERGCGEDVLFAVELVYGELIGNVVRYAAGPTEVVLDLSDAAPVLHVLDRGPGFRMTPRLPYDDLSERGRGLFIINELVEQFHVLLREGGGSHASAVLRTGL